jgi:hypothetical protein
MARNTRTRYFPLGGGVDVVSPALSIPPGRALTLINYEPWYNGGYRSLDGYERYDGRPKPSDATFIGFDVSTVAGLSLGDTVTGGTSGATGVVCGIWDDDGTYGADALAVTKVTGTFDEGETLTGGTGTRTVDSTPVTEYAPSSELEDEFLLGAQDEYRDDIAAVPGSGEVRGIWRRGDTVYAIRNNAGGTAGILHRNSSSGWTTSGITLTHYLYFDVGGGGTAQAMPQEGVTINGETSGVTAVVHRVVEHEGATATNDLTGYLVLRTISGTFLDGENLRVVTTKFAEAASASTQVAFPIDGEYRFKNHNFYAYPTLFRTYGVNGESFAFEIDESHFVSPILLPQVAQAEQPLFNTPHLLEVHRNYLFLAFPGGRVVHSAPGEPLTFSGFLGAAEFGLGAELTGLNSIEGGVLVMSTERFTEGLYGSSTDDWEKKRIGGRTGARLFTAEQLDTVYGLDDLGITSLARTDKFGDFQGSTVSQLVQPTVQSLRPHATQATVVRARNQYRLYFDDGKFLIMYVPTQGSVATARGTNTPLEVEFGVGEYPTPVERIFNTEDEDGTERTYFASDDGYVYEDRIGTSFDGDEIESYCRTAFTHLGSPAMRKKYRRLDLEISADRPLQLSFVHDLSYGSSELSSATSAITTAETETLDVLAGAGFWDVSNWDEFYWDGQNISTARADLNGSGANIGFLIYHASAVARPHVLQGMTVHYDLRRLER